VRFFAGTDYADDALTRTDALEQAYAGGVPMGSAQEAIHDVACSDGGVPDAATRRCPANGASVNLTDCSVSAHGAASLSAAWRDPDFDPAQRAVYYVRVLENSSCRWRTWDAIRLGEQPPAGVVPTLQERAWSSPIWLHPA